MVEALGYACGSSPREDLDHPLGLLLAQAGTAMGQNIAVPPYPWFAMS